MYSKKVAAAIKVNGQVLRENGDKVILPFGSEYSVLVKNLNSVRIKFKVSVDGQEATEGTWIIAEPNASVELERFIKKGNWSCGNRFKFIKRTGEIENHRGIKVDDGLVRIEYETEQVEVVETVHRNHYVDHYYDNYPYWPYTPWPRPYYPGPIWTLGDSRFYKSGLSNTTTCNTSNNVSGSSLEQPTHTSGSILRSQSPQSTRRIKSSGISGQSRGVHVNNCSMRNSLDPGITVPGSISNQQFVQGAWFKTTGQSEVLIIHLVGQVGGKKVMKAVTVKTKASCQTCGKSNKAGNQFCSSCGSALTVV